MKKKKSLGSSNYLRDITKNCVSNLKLKPSAAGSSKLYHGWL